MSRLDIRVILLTLGEIFIGGIRHLGTSFPGNGTNLCMPSYYGMYMHLLSSDMDSPGHVL